MNKFERFHSFIFLSIVAAVVTFSPSLAFCQRAIGAGSIILDAGDGNKITILPPPGLTGNYVYTLPEPPGGNIMSGYVAAGTSIGQTLYWNGSYWAPGAVGGGNFIVNGTSLQSSASFNIDGSGQVGTTLTAGGNINSGGAYQIGGNVVLSDAGLFNLFAGENAGSFNSGEGNTFSGYGTGQVNTSAEFNTFSGYVAGGQNTTGGGNTFLGSNAGYFNTTGTFNTSIGFAAEVPDPSNLTNATAIGAHAVVNASNTIQLGDGNVTSVISNGSFNTTGGAYQIGGSTVLSNGGGFYDVYVGVGAGAVNSGQANTFSGYQAGTSNTSGNFNTFSGYVAGSGNTTGAGNTFLGSNAGDVTTTGGFNTGSGTNALASNTTGSNNTALGNSADVGSGNLSNATAIGANAVVNASNTIQFGNSSVTSVVTHGSFNSTGGGFQTNGTTRIDASGNGTLATLSVGNSSALQVDVNGNLTTTGNVLLDATSTTALEPRILGFKNPGFTSLHLGDQFNTIQNGQGERTQITSYWGIELYGHEQGTVPSFASGTGSDPNVNIYGATGLDVPQLRITRGSSGQTSALQQWTDQTGAVLASIDHSGNAILPALSASGTVTLTGLAAGTPTNFLAIDASHHVVLASGVGGITGSGTSGTIPIWTGASTQGNSNLTDNGTTLAYSGKIINTDSAYQLGGGTVLNDPGFDNIFVGVGAGESNTSGADNTFIGANAGQNSTTGIRNTFLGVEAGINAGGIDNTFTGYQSGESNTGSSNTFSGAMSGQDNHGGGGNTYSGSQSGQNNTSGSFNTLSGNGTGFDNFSGSYITAFGAGADVGADGLTNATAIGANAYVSQNNSLVLGSISGVNSATASTKVGIGTSSPFTTLDVNGFINTDSAYQIGDGTVLTDPGFDNIFVGVGAGANNTTGILNTFSGNGAGESNTSGSDNTFIGANAGQFSTTGIRNTFLGVDAGINAGGIANTFTGYQSGESNTGSSNTFSGAMSGQDNHAGGGNTYSGSQSGQNNTSGSFNTLSGDGTGFDNFSGSYITAFGAGADVGADGLTNATAIGANAYVSQNNSLVLGSINGVNSATASTNVGIGTSAPRATLDVTATDAIIVPVGSTAQRPGIPVQGMLRFNSTTALLENYDGSSWNSGGGGGISGSGNTGTIPIWTGSTTQGNSHINDNATTLAYQGKFINITGDNFGDAFQINGSTVLSDPGTFNIFVGVGSGQSNSGGIQNTFVGASAGASNSSAGGNTFVGAGSGSHTTTSGANTFVGDNAGNANTAGGNTFVGAGAGEVNTTGVYNTFFGLQTGIANTTGDSNSFIGTAAGWANTTGSLNTFEGFEAGYANTTGAANTFIGIESGDANTTASSNTFVGEGSGFANSTGGANTFLGAEAGTSNTTANGNTFVGGAAGIANTTGQYNAIFGFQAGYVNTIGDSNSFIGTAAGQSNTTGSLNTFTGFLAGRLNTTGIGNTFIGDESGLSNTTENSNTFIGYSSNGAASITNATAIGSGAVVGQSNALILGNSADVGIRTSTPRAALDINSTGAMIVPAGTSSQRPGAPVRGMLRFNSTSGQLENYDGSSWNSGGGGISGSGTAGTIPIWTDVATQGNSSLTDDGTTLSYLGQHINTGLNYQINHSTVVATNGVDGGNLYLGDNSGNSSINTSTDNTFVGESSGTANTTGTGNTFIGERTGFSNTTGYHNTVIGESANVADDAYNAIAIGYNSLVVQHNTIQLGDDNIELVNSTGRFNTSGVYQINASTVVASAGIDNGNLYLGDEAGGSSIASTVDNTFVGEGAGNANTSLDGQGTENTFVGRYAGSENTTGTNNTVLGAFADLGQNDLTDATAIGGNAIVQASNTIQLGDDGVEAVNTFGVITGGGLVILNGSGNDLTGNSWSVDNTGNGTFQSLSVGNDRFDIQNDGTTTITEINNNDALTINGGGGNDITGTNDNWQVDGSGNFNTGDIALNGTGSDALIINGGGGNDITGTNNNWFVDGSGNSAFNTLALNTPLTINNGGTNELPDGQIIIGTGGTPNFASLAGDATMDDDGNVTVFSYNDGSSFGDIVSQDAENVEITGGTIDGTVIGFDQPADGEFTTLSAGSSQLSVDGDGNLATNGTLTSNGAINSANADLETNGTTRIDNAGNITAANITVGGNLVVSTESDAEFNDFVTISGNTVFAEVTGDGSGPIGVIVTNATSGQMLYIYNHSTGAQQLTLNNSVIPQGKIEVFVYYGGNWIGTN